MCECAHVNRLERLRLVCITSDEPQFSLAYTNNLFQEFLQKHPAGSYIDVCFVELDCARPALLETSVCTGRSVTHVLDASAAAAESVFMAGGAGGWTRDGGSRGEVRDAGVELVRRKAASS